MPIGRRGKRRACQAVPGQSFSYIGRWFIGEHFECGSEGGTLNGSLVLCACRYRLVEPATYILFFLKKMSTFGSICREMMYFK